MTTHATGNLSPRGFARELLALIDAPDTPGNEAVIEAWEMREGGHWLNTARFNPLNTTENEPGATSINSVGVKAYTSWSEGLVATFTTLTNGLYSGILAGLRRDDQKAAVLAIAQSPWGGGANYHPYLESWPTAASAAAYVKAHGGGDALKGGNADDNGGDGWSANPVTDIKKVGGMVADIPGQVTGAIGDAFGAVVDDVKSLSLTIAFAGLGLGLIALGAWRVSQPARAKVQSAAQTAAEAGVMAA